MAIKAYYRFNGNSNDASGNNKNLTSQNTTLGNGGINGNILYSGSVNSYSYVSGSIMTISGDKMLSCICTPVTVSTSDSWEYIVRADLWDGTNELIFSIELSRAGGTPRFYAMIDSTTQDYATYNPIVVANQKYHLASILTDSELILFVNGTMVSAPRLTSLSTGSITPILRIGGDNASDIHCINAYIDETKIIQGSEVGLSLAKNEYSRIKGFFSN